MAQCTATAKSTGQQCQKEAMKGTNVCYQHGGAAPQVQRKAQERLDRMADAVTADVADILGDLKDLYDEADPDDKLAIQQAIHRHWTTILDRTGHGPTAKRELEHSGEVEGFEFTINYDEH